MIGPAGLMVEAGCNDGTDSLEFLAEMPGLQLHCFEPDPRAIARFRRNVSGHRVTLWEAALSDVDGHAVFHGSSGVPPAHARGPEAPACCHLDEWDLSGSLFAPTGHLRYSPWVTFPSQREYGVWTMRLDTWLAAHPEITTIDFLWADVQGAEGALVSGGQEALRRTRFFYTEFYDSPMYAGQPSLTEIHCAMPGGQSAWTVRRVDSANALFTNRYLTGPPNDA